MQARAPKLLFPQLQSFYQWAEPLSWALVRMLMEEEAKAFWSGAATLAPEELRPF